MSRLARYYLPGWLSLALNGVDLLTYWHLFHRLFAVLHLASVVLHCLAVAHHARHAHPRRAQG